MSVSATLEDIAVPVDARTAETYRKTDEEERRRIGRIVADEVHRQAVDELFRAMNELSREAQARGLTPEILQEILDER